MNLSNLTLYFVDEDKNFVSYYKKFFGDLYNAKFGQGNLIQVPQSDSLICFGDSYGNIDHKINRTILLTFNNTEEKICNVINNIYYGEQPVGTTSIINTENPKYKFILYTPIFRSYDDKNCYDFENNKNPYIVFRAILTAILNHNKISDTKIKSVIIT